MTTLCTPDSKQWAVAVTGTLPTRIQVAVLHRATPAISILKRNTEGCVPLANSPSKQRLWPGRCAQLTHVRKIVFIRKTVLKLITLPIALVVAPAFAQTAVVTVVEFYNKPLDAYFISGRLAEQQTLDASSDFRRTGMTFAATAASAPEAGAKRICRFYIQLSSPPTSSHFYGREGVDCAQIQAQNLSGFTYEGFDFAIAEPTGGVCPSGTTTVYRGFRRAAGGKTPNHRYTTSPETYIAAQAAGYAPESAAFCAATATDVVPTVASTQKCGTFYYPGQRITYQSLASDGTPGSFQRFLNATTTTFNGRADATAVEERYAASATQLNVIINGATTWTALGTSSTDSAGLNEIYYSNPTVYPKDFAVSQAIPINRQLTDRKSTRLNSSHRNTSRMPSSA